MEPDKRKHRLELFEAIVLSVAVVLAAWSVYQSARWSGIQSLRLAEGRHGKPLGAGTLLVQNFLSRLTA